MKKLFVAALLVTSSLCLAGKGELTKEEYAKLVEDNMIKDNFLSEEGAFKKDETEKGKKTVKAKELVERLARKIKGDFKDDYRSEVAANLSYFGVLYNKNEIKNK